MCRNPRKMPVDFKAETFQLMRFTLIGVGVTSLYLVLSLALREMAGFSILLSSSIAMCAAFAGSYFGHKMVTFRAAGEHRLYVKRFLAVAGSVFIIQAVVMELAQRYFPAHYIYANLGICGTIPVISYLLNRFIVFAR